MSNWAPGQINPFATLAPLSNVTTQQITDSGAFGREWLQLGALSEAQALIATNCPYLDTTYQTLVQTSAVLCAYDPALPSSLPVPSNTYTPLDLNYGISSINTFYKYPSVTQINPYVLPYTGGAPCYYAVDSNTCYGNAFSNITGTSYCESLYLVAGWSNSRGWFDVYNDSDITIYFQSEFGNEGVNILPGTNRRVVLRHWDDDPPIEILPITGDGLPTLGTLTSLYTNHTYMTQGAQTTTLEIDLGGVDTNNATMSGHGTLVVNASVAVSSNLSVGQLHVDTISPYSNASLAVTCDVSTNYTNLLNVQSLGVDYIYPVQNAVINAFGGMDMNGTTLGGVSQINVDAFAPYTQENISVTSDLNFTNNNSIWNVQALSVDYITTANYTTIAIASSMDMNNNSIFGASEIHVDTLYQDLCWYSIPNTADFYMVRFASYPGSAFSAPWYLSYAVSPSDASAWNFKPVAADWCALPAYQSVDFGTQDINNVERAFINHVLTDYISPNLNTAIDFQNNILSNVGQVWMASVKQPFIQFGKATANTTVTLAHIYGSDDYSVFLSYMTSGGTSYPYAGAVTASNFYLHGTAGQTLSWQAVGYL